MSPREPLWLPPGSVRAIMGLALVLVFVWVVIRSAIVIDAKDLNTIVTLVVGFYFISKAVPRGGAG